MGVPGPAPTFVHMAHRMNSWLSILCSMFFPVQDGLAQDRAVNLYKQWELQRSEVTDQADTLLTRFTNELAIAYQEQGKPDSALHFARMAIKFAEQGSEQGTLTERSRWLGLLLTAQRIEAAQLFFLNRYPESITAIKRYLGTAEELRLPEEIGAAYNYLGYCYNAMEDVPAALHWSNKALGILKRNEGQDLANAYVGIAGLHFELGQRDSALICLREALRLYERLDEPVNKASALGMITEAYLEMDMPDSVDRYLGLLREVTNAHGGARMRMRMRLDLIEGQVALQQGRVPEAMLLLERADSMATAMEDHRQRYFIGRQRAIGHALRGEVRRADALFDRAVDDLKKDLDLSKVRTLAAAQAKAEQEKAIATSEAKAEAYRKGRWFAWAMAGGGLSTALLLGMLYRQGRRNAKRLAAAQDELLRSEKQREAERVRMNVSRDVHDELGGSLSKIALLSDLAQHDQGSDAGIDRLRSIAEQARLVRGALNDVVWAADPSSDTAGALLQHIADRAHRLLEGTGVELHLDLHADDPAQPLGAAMKRDLSMVVKEALNNAMKHARSTTIKVQFHIGGSQYEIAVIDNGQGYDPERTNGGNGVPNMRERIHAHGGSFDMRRGRNGVGTVVEARGGVALN